jgi:hypothetical protein
MEFRLSVKIWAGSWGNWLCRSNKRWWRVESSACRMFWRPRSRSEILMFLSELYMPYPALLGLHIPGRISSGG